MRTLIVALLLAIPVFAQNVGQVSFANSGAAEAQEPFLRGLALLHNFEYPTAAEAFREAQRLDPNFAMAYWGEAMTYTHPVWFQQDAEAARAVLERLGATAEERLAKAKTKRERDYLRALDVLYGDGTKDERDLAYADAMATLHAKYPDDVDATAFYALSLLGTAHGGRDFTIYMRAAALLEEVFPTHKQHPGVLHYMIHCYDDPAHAPLGMRAARLYGAVAPNAGHALHMTSHIFVAMGMWNEVIDANRRAIAVVNAQRAAQGKPPADCGHYPTWLHYGYLQTKRADEARKALDACRASASMDPQSSSVQEYVMMRAHHAAAGYALTPADTLSIPAGPEYAKARFFLAYADMLAASTPAALKSATARLRAAKDDVLARAAKDTNPADRIAAEVALQEADALELIATDHRADALPILAAATKAEQAMPLEFGPPLVPKPAAELYAEQLLAAGRPADAAAAYRTALERTPGRVGVVEGLKRISEQPPH